MSANITVEVDIRGDTFRETIEPFGDNPGFYVEVVDEALADARGKLLARVAAVYPPRSL